MPNVTQEQWQEWQNHPVTEALRVAIKVRLSECSDQVLLGPNNTREFDQYVKGLFRGLSEVLEFKPEVKEDDSEV